MTPEHFGTHKGYEFYRQVTKHIGRYGTDKAAQDFATLMPWSTPAQVLEKLAHIHSVIGMNGIMCHFSYAGMPYDEAERHMQCFVKHVLPELKKWATPPLIEPAPLALQASAA